MSKYFYRDETIQWSSGTKQRVQGAGPIWLYRETEQPNLDRAAEILPPLGLTIRSVLLQPGIGDASSSEIQTFMWKVLVGLGIIMLIACNAAPTAEIIKTTEPTLTAGDLLGDLRTECDNFRQTTDSPPTEMADVLSSLCPCIAPGSGALFTAESLMACDD